MIPSNLKIGDSFTDYGVKYQVIGFDYEGRYISKVVGASAPTPVEVKTVEVKAETTGDEYENMSIKELQNLCREKGLIVRGSKAEVIERLKGAK